MTVSSKQSGFRVHLRGGGGLTAIGQDLQSGVMGFGDGQQLYDARRWIPVLRWVRVEIWVAITVLITILCNTCTFQLQ
jgi:hypothetical protein